MFLRSYLATVLEIIRNGLKGSLGVSVFIETCIGLQVAGWTLHYRSDLFSEHISEETHFTLMNWLLRVIYSGSRDTVRTEHAALGLLLLFRRASGSSVDVINNKIRMCVFQLCSVFVLCLFPKEKFLAILSDWVLQL